MRDAAVTNEAPGKGRDQEPQHVSFSPVRDPRTADTSASCCCVLRQEPPRAAEWATPGQAGSQTSPVSFSVLTSARTMALSVVWVSLSKGGLVRRLLRSLPLSQWAQGRLTFPWVSHGEVNLV